MRSATERTLGAVVPSTDPPEAVTIPVTMVGVDVSMTRMCTGDTVVDGRCRPEVPGKTVDLSISSTGLCREEKDHNMSTDDTPTIDQFRPVVLR